MPIVIDSQPAEGGQTFSELVQEVIDRGYNHIATHRIEKAVQRAHRVLCSRYPWPFLEKTTIGEAPLEVADLRHVLSVSVDGRSISPADRRWLVETDLDLSATGAASFWYLENKTLKFYPADTAEVTVRYVARSEPLGPNEEPLVPAEWQYLLVDMAVADLPLKNADEYEVATELKTQAREGIAEMAHALLSPNHQAPQTLIRTGQPGDYL